MKKETISEDRLMIALRFQAWEKARAELQGLLHTYWGTERQKTYPSVNKIIKSFIKEMEEKIG